MSKKIRVYELARELGLSNKEGLDLCLAMGIGVTSHSSSIEEAQADRVRRKAEREGLKRAHPPEEVVAAAGPAAAGPAAAGPVSAGAVRPSLVAGAPASAVVLTEAAEARPGITARSHPMVRTGTPPGGPPAGVVAPAGAETRDGGALAARRATSVPSVPGPAGHSAGAHDEVAALVRERPEPVVDNPGSQTTAAPSRPLQPPPGLRTAGTGLGGSAGPGPAPAGAAGRAAPEPAASAPANAPQGHRDGHREGVPAGAPSVQDHLAHSPGQARPGTAATVAGGGSSAPAGHNAPPAPAAQSRTAGPGPQAPVRPAHPGGPDGTGPGAAQGRAAVSPMTGKPIPPPPGFRARPVSPLTGKPIPPPARPSGGGGDGYAGSSGQAGGPSRNGGSPGGPGRPPGSAPYGAGGGGRYADRPGQGRPPMTPGSRPPGARSGPGGPMTRSGPGGSAGAGGPRPGMGGGSARPGSPGGPGGAVRPGGGPGMRPGGGARPIGGPRTGGPLSRGTDATYRPPATGGGPYRGGVPGAGLPPRGAGRPGGGPGGPGGRGRPGGRRSRRSKHSREELEAQTPTTYTPSHAPVPEGEVIIERGSTAQDLAPRLNRSAADVVRFLFSQGEMVTATMSLSDDMIELFAAEIGASVRLVEPGEQKEAELQARYFAEEDDEESEDVLRPRPPVVTVMGHVDHGKTSLLDRIRESDVASGETGGITQHIGAYQVTTATGSVVTFIDTPGHEAFTAMRARGAEVTDIVVLVVAADDGVMPQTVEALNHAKAADVPVIVAINKIDRADADPNHVMQQLSELGLVPERWGGDTIMVEVSALQNLGIDDLLEQLMVVAEVEELRANPEGRARGVVLEANLDPGKGPVATVIVQNGTLRVGDNVVAGAAWGRVKALIDDKGDNIKEAPPSFPAQVLGFDTLPAAGDDLRAVLNSRTAREVAEQREQRFRSADLRRSSAATSGGAKLEDIFEQIQRGEAATLNLVVKADVQGSLEAVTESLRKLERDDVKLAFVHRAVGGITENDVALAAASNATIIGFNVRPGRESRSMAAAQGVEIRTYEIIYKLIEDIQAAMVGMLAPEYEEVLTGEAEVRELFRIPRIGAIAGCYIRTGVITRGSKVRFLRDGVIIWKGAITSLRRFKEDVREVHEGFECGIGLSNNQDLRPGDIIETYEEREIPRT